MVDMVGGIHCWKEELSLRAINAFLTVGGGQGNNNNKTTFFFGKPTNMPSPQTREYPKLAALNLAWTLH